jgi:RimJ/RimL family protein N-acetyltransferase
MQPAPVTLEGRLVRLDPMTTGHVDALSEVGLDPRIWEWNAFPVRDRDEMRAYVETALSWEAAGTAVPFVTVDRASGRVVGSTRFGAIDTFNLHVEIGWTWLHPDYWRSGLNTEAKLLMLGHAFGHWGCRRVELKTDAENARSRAAIERIGGRLEGIFRKHMVTATERMRDTAWYSILDGEWPEVRARLEAFLAAPHPRRPAA